MNFQRGNPVDYDRWAEAPGMQTRDHAHCPPYFKRMETCTSGADAWRGGDGPLVLERGPATNPLFGAFFAAAQQAGYPLTNDVNGARQEGFAPFDRDVHRGRRLSASRATCIRFGTARTCRCTRGRWPPGSCSPAPAPSGSSTCGVDGCTASPPAR
jgi:choline dehydrogenase-like flavoprotein